MVVDVKNVSISYLVGDYKDIGFKEYIVQCLKGTYSVQKFRAVNNVSFQLESGDFLGIIGTNGAGKSTLLKAVSGVMRPQEGSIKVKGQVAALLELGTGFDGELTIRENIYLRGALLGYTEKFMNEKYPEIVEFAELKDFQDRKFRQLSSGMKSRIAFSIASLVDPDVLILDEVLSVGDAAFRAKSEKKMLDIIHNGVTTLFVSHSSAQIRRLCNKALWLNKGEQMAFGDAKPVCDEYDRFLKSCSK